MASSLRLGLTRALLLSGAAIAPAACAALLGDDFTVAPAASTGGAATGGTGGEPAAGGSGGSDGGMLGTGGTGGEPPPSFACDWELASHLELARLEGTTDYYQSAFHVVRRDADSARIIAGKRQSSTDIVEVRTVGFTTGPLVTTFPSNRLFQVERTSIQEIGALHLDTSGSEPVLKLQLIQDGQDDGAFSNEIVLTGSAAFPEIDTTSDDIDARFTVVAGTVGSPVIDLVASWRITGGQYNLGYARYQGSPVVFVKINQSPFAQNDDCEIIGLAHADGTSYAFIGEASSLGGRRYELGPTVVGPIAPEPLGQLDTFMFSVGKLPMSVPMAAVSFGPPLEMLVGQIDHDLLGEFDINDDFAVAGSYDTIEEIPALVGEPAWQGSLLTMIGSSLGRPRGEKLLTYRFLDTLANERALAQLPFTGVLPSMETRSEGFLAANSAAVEPDFDTEGGTLHVAWSESHESPSDSGFAVVYYDRLVCTLEP